MWNARACYQNIIISLRPSVGALSDAM